MGNFWSQLFAAALPSLEQALVPLISGLIGKLFHHDPTPSPAGVSTPTLPPSVVVGTPVAPAPPSLLIPGELKILGAIDSNTGQPVSLPFGDDTHIHLDHNLANPLPWPSSISGVSVISSVDGGPDDTCPWADGGSVDPDGYASRFNIHTIPDNLPHKLELALKIGDQVGPWLLLSVHKQAPAPAIYQAAFYKANSKMPNGWEFTNPQNKELAPAGAVFRNDDAANKWIAAKHPPDGSILKSPFTF